MSDEKQAAALTAAREPFLEICKKLARTGTCERFEGSFAHQRFVGCDAYRDKDPQTYCLTCEAEAAIRALGEDK